MLYLSSPSQSASPGDVRRRPPPRGRWGPDGDTAPASWSASDPPGGRWSAGRISRGRRCPRRGPLARGRGRLPRGRGGRRGGRRRSRSGPGPRWRLPARASGPTATPPSPRGAAGRRPARRGAPVRAHRSRASTTTRLKVTPTNTPHLIAPLPSTLHFTDKLILGIGLASRTAYQSLSL